MNTHTHSRNIPSRVAEPLAEQRPLTSPPVFSDLHLLTVIGQLRSYTKTAARLGISKATVSQRISALERAAGVPLVQRSTRSVALTAAGQQLCDDTMSAFSRIEESFAAIRDLASTPRGLIRITAPVALGRQRVMPALTPFLLKNPDIRIELALEDRMVNLTHEGFDLAIRHSQQVPDNCVAWPLCATTARLYASPAYLRRAGMPDRPVELSRHACLVYLREGANTHNWTLRRRRTRRSPEICTVSVQGLLKTNNSEVLREAALGGLGIAMLPDFSADQHVHDERSARQDRLHPQAPGLVPVLPDWDVQGVFGDTIHALRPSGVHVPRSVRALIQHLREHFQGIAPDKGS